MVYQNFSKASWRLKNLSETVIADSRIFWEYGRKGTKRHHKKIHQRKYSCTKYFGRGTDPACQTSMNRVNDDVRLWLETEQAEQIVKKLL